MYCGFIVELHGVHKHSNADRLQCVEVFGNNIIVDMSYHDGQKVVFFPVDGQLDEGFASTNGLLRKRDEEGNEIGGYMDPDKRNIKAIKLRGERSEGLVLPVETLAPYVDITTLGVGDKITEFGGTLICQKYIPHKHHHDPSNHTGTSKRNLMKEKYPLFAEHVETEQLMYNQEAFKPGDKCIISLKLHGSSGRSSRSLEISKEKQRWYQKVLRRQPREVREWVPVTGSRRKVIDEFGDDNRDYYGTNEFRKPYHDFFASRLEKGEEVYYEIVGYVNKDTPIMGSVSTSKLKDKEIKKLYGDTMVFSYGCEPGFNDIYVYRMTMTNEDGYTVEYSDALMRLRCEQMGVKCVPKFEEFVFTTWEDLMERVEKYYDGPDPIGRTHVREGVVVRIENREKFKVYKHKNFTFKLVSGIISENFDADNVEVSEDILSEL